MKPFIIWIEIKDEIYCKIFLYKIFVHLKKKDES